MCDLNKLKAFDSAEISDALDAMGIEGVLLGLAPIQLGHKIIGPAYTVMYLPYEEKPNAYKTAGNYIDNVPQGAIVVVDNQGRLDCTTWGDILTAVAIKKGIQGTLLNGACRDVESIRTLQYPLYSKGITMRSGKNRVYKAYEKVPLKIGGVSITPDDIIFADDNGALVIPREHVEEVILKAGNIKQTELRILAAVHQGLGLEEARKQHRYDMPWLPQTEKA